MLIKYNFFYLCIGVLLLFIATLYHPVGYVFGIIYVWFLYSQFGIKSCLLYVVIAFLFFNIVSYPKECSDSVLSGTIITTNEKYIVVKHQGAKIKVYGTFEDYHIDD